jgi:hypothetical protein
MSVEGNGKIEEEFNKILKEEYRQEWQTIPISPVMVAVLCYALPALLLIGAQDYHHSNIVATLFFSAIIGTGFYAYYRNYAVTRAFFSNSKPKKQVLQELRAQENIEARLGVPDGTGLNEDEEHDWNTLVSQLEASMESDTMTLSTLFDRAETNQATLPRRSWFSRLFRRN